MTTVLEEWGLNTDSAELEAGNRSKRDLDDKILNLRHDNM